MFFSRFKNVITRSSSRVLFLFCFGFSGFGQSGTSGDPFTSLGMALTVTSPGIYYFDLSGTTFDTYVDASGYIQVALDFGDGVGDLLQGTSLDSTTRGILNAAVLAALTDANEVRISTSTGDIDVGTNDATIISRVINNQTLHKGTIDNGINDFWTGTNAARFTVNASCGPGINNNLHQKIFHCCGATTSFNWLPYAPFQRELWSAGESPDEVSFHLWVRDNSVLPIELQGFSVQKVNDRFVDLKWTTLSELDNDYFEVERSSDGVNWNNIGTVNGAGNSSLAINYNFRDFTPVRGVSYYRLKQVDFNGEYTFSPEKSVNLGLNKDVQFIVYPNPAVDVVVVEADSPIDLITIYNSFGQEIGDYEMKSTLVEHTYIINVSHLSRGIYYLELSSERVRFFKE